MGPIRWHMISARGLGALIAAATLVLAAQPRAAAQTPAHEPPASQPADIGANSHPTGAAATQPAAAEAGAPLRGPAYMSLRYDEDYSYLEGPEGSYKKDFFDPIKNIKLDDDWRLSIGGQIRFRVEAETNRGFGATLPPAHIFPRRAGSPSARRGSLGRFDIAQDTYLLQRHHLHFDLRYRDRFRVFVDGITAMVDDRDLGLVADMENRFDIHQAFFDYRIVPGDEPLTVRFGRQEMTYGRDRVIGKSTWGNVGRKFDGLKLLWRPKNWEIDGFYMRPVPIDLSEGLNRKLDHYREEQHLWGIYNVFKGIKNHYIEFYYLGISDKGELTNANFQRGDLTLHMMGGRAGGKCGPWDYDTEVVGEFGTFAGDELHAWLYAADLGYTFKDLPWTPRIGAGFDYGSGDDDPSDGAHETYVTLFSTSHSQLGFIDLMRWSNVLAQNINLTFKPHKDWTARIAWYTFWNDSVRDAYTSDSGVQIRRLPGGGAGHEIGEELDVTLDWKIDVHSSLLFGWSHFWPDNYVNATGFSRDADFFYLQYLFRF